MNRTPRLPLAIAPALVAILFLSAIAAPLPAWAQGDDDAGVTVARQLSDAFEKVAAVYQREDRAVA